MANKDKSKYLSAKRYLEQVKRLDTKINQKMQQLEDLKSMSTSIGGIDYSERVQTSPSGDSLCRSVTNYVALEEEIKADLDIFIELKSKIINQIHALDDVKYINLLFKRYVEFKRFEVIAVEMKYSYQYTRNFHIKALREFKKIINK